MKELEEELSNRPPAGTNQRATDELRSKLLAAETLCEELMDENEDMKRELRDMEEEMEEMQDNFRCGMMSLSNQCNFLFLTILI